MVPVLITVAMDDEANRRLAALQGVAVHTLFPREKDWELPAGMVPAQVMLCKVPPRNLDAMTNLNLIQLSSVGYEHLRHLGLGDRPLRVCNARGLFDTAIAEWNLAMMVNLVRDVPRMVHNMETAAWDRAARFQQEVRGRVVGLWGYGGIGRETARLARVFGMTVHVMTRSGIKPRHNIFPEPGTGDPDGVLPDRVYVTGQEKAFLSELDFLILALPHTKQSDGMIGEEQFRALPKTAFVLNVARGPIIQEAALLRALAGGWIAGAALDTHFAYPLPPGHPLWRMPNVILTPHISGAEKSIAFPGRIGRLFLENLTRHLKDEPLLNEVTAQDWSEAG
jgi:phosphoglycerate dehydrogenase-like enzyme